MRDPDLPPNVAWPGAVYDQAVAYARAMLAVETGMEGMALIPRDQGHVEMGIAAGIAGAAHAQAGRDA